MNEERSLAYKLKNTHIDLLALMPCPIKVPFEKIVEDYVKNHPKDSVRNLNLVIEGHANHHLSFYEHLKEITEIEQVPEIIITPGINTFFFPYFKEKFIDKGCFEAVLPKEQEKKFNEIKYLDPKNRYTMFTMNPLVMVVNKALLGEAKVPTKLGDLRKPSYKNNIILRGQNDTFCESVLLTYEKVFGKEALNELAGNIKFACHPANMCKLARQGTSEGAAIYVMPYFYARGLEGVKNIEVIWPEEGAIVNAVSMLVKKNASDEVMALARFIVEEEVSRVLSGAFFPTAYRVSTNDYMKNLLWMGWEHINNDTLGDKITSINKEFYEIYAKISS